MAKKILSTLLLLSLLLVLTETATAQRRFGLRKRLPARIVLKNRHEAANTMKHNIMNHEAVQLKVILDLYQAEALRLFRDMNRYEWEAMTTGHEEAFRKATEAKLAWAKYHGDKEKYEEITDLAAAAKGLSDVDVRAVERMHLAFSQNQLPSELQRKMLEMSSTIEMVFQTHRGRLDGKEYTNNELLTMLEKEVDSDKRRKIWEALKQVGSEVDAQVVALAKVRNEAAGKLGFDNYWEMQVYFQDYRPEELTAIFDELERMTTPVFVAVKRELDEELAAKFGIAPAELMPWHYDNPFFQQAPPSKDVDPNDFYKDKTKEEIIDIAVQYYRRLGLPYEEILKRSDMFEREGKNQHAFSFDMDTLGDVRNLCNVKPTADWMDTVLHEGGHGVYSLGCNRQLPFNLRDSAHIFTTEAVAMMFGAKAREPKWMIRFAGVDPEKANAAALPLKRQRIREQLIFCRWTLVMLHFEKALYERTAQGGDDIDLKTLWWDMVEKYQLLKRPPGRNAGDWASKPHFVIAPVYYHNYMLGELFAAQLRRSLGTHLEEEDAQAGQILTDKVFFPGALYPWTEFVRRATGEPLSAEAFSEELK